MDDIDEDGNDSDLSDTWSLLNQAMLEPHSHSADSDSDSFEVLPEIDNDGKACLSDTDASSIVGPENEDLCVLNDCSQKQYVYHSNNAANTWLNMVVALSVAYALGLGTGHYIGHQEKFSALTKALLILEKENGILKEHINDKSSGICNSEEEILCFSAEYKNISKCFSIFGPPTYECSIILSDINYNGITCMKEGAKALKEFGEVLMSAERRGGEHSPFLRDASVNVPFVPLQNLSYCGMTELLTTNQSWFQENLKTSSDVSVKNDLDIGRNASNNSKQEIKISINNVASSYSEMFQKDKLMSELRSFTFSFYDVLNNTMKFVENEVYFEMKKTLKDVNRKIKESLNVLKDFKKSFKKKKNQFFKKAKDMYNKYAQFPLNKQKKIKESKNYRNNEKQSRNIKRGAKNGQKIKDEESDKNMKKKKVYTKKFLANKSNKNRYSKLNKKQQNSNKQEKPNFGGVKVSTFIRSVEKSLDQIKRNQNGFVNENKPSNKSVSEDWSLQRYKYRTYLRWTDKRSEWLFERAKFRQHRRIENIQHRYNSNTEDKNDNRRNANCRYWSNKLNSARYKMKDWFKESVDVFRNSFYKQY